MSEATVRTDVPVPPDARGTLVELSDVIGPKGETDTDRLTVPAKPLWLARSIVVVPEALDWMVRDG